MKVEYKVYKEHFKDILEGKKDFEIRLGDKKIREGDTIILEEIDEKKEKTGRIISRKIKYVYNTKNIEKYYKKNEIEKYGLNIIGFETIDENSTIVRLELKEKYPSITREGGGYVGIYENDYMKIKIFTKNEELQKTILLEIKKINFIDGNIKKWL